MKVPDMVYCMEQVNDVTIAGAGDGSIYAFENNTGQCLYG